MYLKSEYSSESMIWNPLRHNYLYGEILIQMAQGGMSNHLKSTAVQNVKLPMFAHFMSAFKKESTNIFTASVIVVFIDE